MRISRLKILLCLFALPPLLAACGGNDSNSGTAAQSFTIGGSVSGLAAAGLVLANGNDTASPASGSTTFSFPITVSTGGSYDVKVSVQPSGESCAVANGSGAVGSSNVTNVTVTCSPNAYNISGSISGLTTAGLLLANGQDTVSPAANATGFTFPNAVTTGSAYAVTIAAQPTNATCSVAQATGTVGTGAVSNVAVSCAPNAFTLGGTISGLASAGLVLANGSDTLSLAVGSQAFTFANPVAEGGTYTVTVQAQPQGTTCSVGNGSGTMGGANLVSVQVTCSPNAYKVGGSITGLTVAGLVLANGGDTVSLGANASTFTMPHTVAFGGSYSVTVQQQPPGLTCAVSGTYPATMGAGDVTNVSVTCSVPTQYTLLAGRETCPSGGDNIDGSGAAASVSQESILAFDAAGNAYATSDQQTVRKITPVGVVTTLAGQPYGGLGTPVDGVGAAAVFSNLSAITVDSAGNVYVIDANEIRKVTQAGVVTTLAGSTSAGYRDGTGSAAGFSHPYALTVDPQGNLYVSDTNNSLIRKVTATGVVTTLAGGTLGFANGTGTLAQFNNPRGIVIDASGNLYVNDSGNGVVRKVTPSGVVTSFVGAPGLSYADGPNGVAGFWQLWDLSIDASGDLFAIDAGFTALREITPAGVVTTVATTGYFTTKTGLPRPTVGVQLPALSTPRYFSVNAAGTIYVPIGCAVETVGP